MTKENSNQKEAKNTHRKLFSLIDIITYVSDKILEKCQFDLINLQKYA